MSWLRKLTRVFRRPRRPAAPSAGLREAERVQAWTEDRLGTIKDETPAILGVANRLKSLGEQEDDFAARLRNALGGPR